LVRFDTSRSLGTPATKEKQSIVKLAQWLTRTSFQLQRIASHAAAFLNLKQLATETGFAGMPASLHGAGQVEKTTKPATARNAESNLRSTDTQAPRLVAGRVLTVTRGPTVAKVYDLTVDEHHEFVCGGVLVSNCIDAVRYALEGVRRIQQQKPPKVVILPTASRW
jgi:hypothetical protein